MIPVLYWITAILYEQFTKKYMTKALRVNIDWKLAFCSNGVILAQNFRFKGSSPTNHSLCRKTRINILSCGIRMCAQVSFVLSQFLHLTDRQMDRHSLMAKTALHRCSTVKTTHLHTVNYMTITLVTRQHKTQITIEIAKRWTTSNVFLWHDGQRWTWLWIHTDNTNGLIHKPNVINRIHH